MNIFNFWIHDQCLIDIDIPNKKFTWTNKRRNLILIKLDRILIDTEWSHVFLGTSVKSEVVVTADHNPIIADVTTNIPSSRIFRLENYWLLMPDFESLVMQSWTRGTRSLARISIANYKLRRLRAKIDHGPGRNKT